MTREQKQVLHFAYQVTIGDCNAPYIRFGKWIEPDRDSERPYINEAIFADLVMRGLMECRHFGDRWLYRITPEGCAAIGKTYPGLPVALIKRASSQRDRDDQRPESPDHRDPHRFRRSSDWRRC
ncbi:MAG: hypothetical protein MUF87_03170 [Anaerolineae bacterium]|jgi:hypothetical protein|nr:hypothetical protein [Anaerolineae bacterium]